MYKKRTYSAMSIILTLCCDVVKAVFLRRAVLPHDNGGGAGGVRLPPFLLGEADTV
jgi:hypothetical protein